MLYNMSCYITHVMLCLLYNMSCYNCVMLCYIRYVMRCYIKHVMLCLLYNICDVML